MHPILQESPLKSTSNYFQNMNPLDENVKEELLRHYVPEKLVPFYEASDIYSNHDANEAT